MLVTVHSEGTGGLVIRFVLEAPVDLWARLIPQSRIVVYYDSFAGSEVVKGLNSFASLVWSAYSDSFHPTICRDYRFIRRSRLFLKNDSFHYHVWSRGPIH